MLESYRQRFVIGYGKPIVGIEAKQLIGPNDRT
jgi:hypothetical protein